MDNPQLTRQDASPVPIARLRGEAVSVLPADLYIPPDAMAVFLETFEGPFDLLLYLIRKQNLDILDIPIADVTRQYMEYVEMMKNISLELAADYLVMAAMLAEIKSRMLLPRPPAAEQEEADPRAELVRRLREYEHIRQAAEKLDALPRKERDFFPANGHAEGLLRQRTQPVADLQSLALCLADTLKRARLSAAHTVRKEPLSVRERMSQILATLQETEYAGFYSLFTPAEGRAGVIVTFLALLELVQHHLIDCTQTGSFAPIHIRNVASCPAA